MDLSHNGEKSLQQIQAATWKHHKVHPLLLLYNGQDATGSTNTNTRPYTLMFTPEVNVKSKQCLLEFIRREPTTDNTICFSGLHTVLNKYLNVQHIWTFSGQYAAFIT